jgi:hypothetical protein
VIALCAPTYDPSGHLVLAVHPSNLHQANRRGSVTATLSGEVSVYDAGFSFADQTLSASWSNPTREQMITLTYLIAYYAELVICVETGVFAARASVAQSKNTATLTLRLLRRLDA